MMRNRFALLPVERLRVPPDNFNEMVEQDFAALVAEVRELGTVVHPVVARQDGEDGLIVVDGVHQINAARAVGLREVPVEVLAIDQFEGTRQAFMRNRHGRHNPVKLGRQWRWMRTTSGMTNRALAELLAVSEATVRNMLLYAEAADRCSEREDEISRMGVRELRKLLEDDDEDEGSKAAPAEDPRFVRMNRDWDQATRELRARYMKRNGLVPREQAQQAADQAYSKGLDAGRGMGAARNGYEAAPVQPPPDDEVTAGDAAADDVWLVPPDDLPDAIRGRMEEHGLTQIEVARRIGLANSSGLSRYLKTGRGLGDASITKACGLLGIEVTAPAGQPVDA